MFKSLKLRNLIMVITAIAFFSITPISMSFGQTEKGTPTEKSVTTYATSSEGNNIIPQKNDSIMPTESFPGGTATLSVYDMGSNTMEACYTLHSTIGPISWVDVIFGFDDGYAWTDNRATFWSSTQSNCKQHTFGSPGVHSVCMTGYFWCNGGLDMQTISETVASTIITN